MRSFTVPLFFLYLILSPTNTYAKIFTIFHTNDEHSRLLGFSPDTEYNPQVKGDGTTGGVARLATLLKEKRTQGQKKGAVLTLEGGDFSMGTLFHTISREKGGELQLLQLLQYDAITLGNHEFDFGVKGLSMMISSAIRELGSIPPIVASNLVLSENDPRDEQLRQFAKQGIIRRYLVLEKNGIRFGILGVMGKDADEVLILKEPVSFSNRIETVKNLIPKLRQEEKVDVIIVLSHSGVRRNDENWQGNEVLNVGDDGKWEGEDIELAKEVPDIDVIVGGHSHTPLMKSLNVGKTTIVQAGSEIRYLGEVALALNDGKTKVLNQRLNPIDDQILGDPLIHKKVEELKNYVTETALKPLGVRFEDPVAKVTTTFTRDYSDNVIGNLLSAAFQKAAQSDIGFCPDGIIRDDMNFGKNGIQSFSDIFRLSPIGFGETDEEPGYPMIKVYLTGEELKSVFEVLFLAYKFKGSDYHPRFSGIEIDYNPLRIPLDRIMELRLKRANQSFEIIDKNDNKKLYSVGTNSYVGKFLWIVPDVSMGLFKVTPKFADGKPIYELKNSVIKLDGPANTRHEYKSWRAIYDYIHQLPADSVSKLPLITPNGDFAKSPVHLIASLHPIDLFKNATWIQWVGFLGIILALLSLASLMTWLFMKSRFKRSTRKNLRQNCCPH